jgi:hypothetical protein
MVCPPLLLLFLCSKTLFFPVLEYGSLKPLKREGAHDLDEAVFLSDVSRKDKNNKGFALEEGVRGDHIKVSIRTFLSSLDFTS